MSHAIHAIYEKHIYLCGVIAKIRIKLYTQKLYIILHLGVQIRQGDNVFFISSMFGAKSVRNRHKNVFLSELRVTMLFSKEPKALQTIQYTALYIILFYYLRKRLCFHIGYECLFIYLFVCVCVCVCVCACVYVSVCMSVSSACNF